MHPKRKRLMLTDFMKSVFCNGKAKKHLYQERKEHKEIAAWISMLTEYDHGGETDVLIEKYDDFITTILLESQVSWIMKLPLPNLHL
jgi:hypothetical protein